ncbi:MAG: hypothetical protein WBQ43_04800 [Terriglobales bacterium]
MSTDTREQSVREFKIETDAPNKRREILLLCGVTLAPIVAVLVEVLAAAFIFHPSTKGDAAFRWLVRLTITGTLIGGYIIAFRIAFRLGMQRAKRGMVFALSDEEFIRKRSGWPDDRIAFSEIGGLYDGPGGLVVETIAPLRRISIPREVTGLEAIRAELAKHHSFSLQTRPPRARLSWTGLVVMIVSILSWAAVIFIWYEVMRPR